MSEKVWEVIFWVVGVAIVLLGLYGFVVDIFHGHLGWAVADVFSSGVIAVIRGIGYFFGFINY